MFFSLLFVFMGAMFGIIFSNNLLWLFLFWEITTLCSFLLIGYTGTEDANRNALKALTMNLAGGLAFAVGIVWFYKVSGSLGVSNAGLIRKQAAVLLPVALLSFCRADQIGADALFGLAAGGRWWPPTPVFGAAAFEHDG